MDTTAARTWSPKRLNRAMLEAGITSAELARRIEKSERNVWRWKRPLTDGGHEPRGETVVRIAAATGHDIEFFYVEGDADEDEEESQLRHQAHTIVAPLNESMVDALLVECQQRIAAR